MTWEPLREWVDADERDSVLLHLDAAYREVLDEKWSRLGMWAYTMDYIRDVANKAMARNGFETAPLFHYELMERLAPPAPMSDQNEHVRFV